MPSPVSTNTTSIAHIPLISNARFRAMQTPVDVDKLVARGTPAEQDAALALLILEASTATYGIVHQLLYATVDTEEDELEADRWGRLLIHPRFFPVVQLLNLWTGSDPGSLVAATSLKSVEVAPKRIVIPAGGGGTALLTSSSGPIQFGDGGFGFRGAVDKPPTYARWQYVNGFPVTSLAEPAAAGATEIQVVSSTGILAGTPLRLEDGADREPVTVQWDSLGTTVPCAPLANAHLAGAWVTALPADIERAIGLIVTALVKTTRGAAALIAGSTVADKSSPDPLGAGRDWALAQQLLTQGDYVAVGGSS